MVALSSKASITYWEKKEKLGLKVAHIEFSQIPLPDSESHDNTAS